MKTMEFGVDLYWGQRVLSPPLFLLNLPFFSNDPINVALIIANRAQTSLRLQTLQALRIFAIGHASVTLGLDGRVGFDGLVIRGRHFFIQADGVHAQNSPLDCNRHYPSLPIKWVAT